MLLTPSMRFKAKVLAQKQQPEKQLTRVEQAQQQVQQDTLAIDLQHLKGLQGDAERNKYKKQLIEKYRQTVEAYLRKDDVAGIALVFWWVLWQFDVKGFAATSDIALTAIAKNSSAPTGFKRDPITVYCDELYCLAKDDLQTAADYLLDVIDKLEKGDWQVNKPLSAKLYKSAGDFLATTDVETAIDYYTVALEFDERVGCKKLLRELQDGK